MVAVFVFSKVNQEFVGGFFYEDDFPADRISFLLENVAADLAQQTGETVTADMLTAYRLEGSDAKTLFNLPASQRQVDFDSDGNVTDIQQAAGTPALWVHVTLTGGTISPSGTLYLKNDGVDALAVHAELRDGPDLATSNAVTQLGGQDITGLWALELVNVDTKALADTPLVQMTAGVIDVAYTTTIAPCEVELAEDRLQSIGGYTLKLAQPVRFKIVRALC